MAHRYAILVRDPRASPGQRVPTCLLSRERVCGRQVPAGVFRFGGAVKAGYLVPEIAKIANPTLMALTDGAINQELQTSPASAHH